MNSAIFANDANEDQISLEFRAMIIAGNWKMNLLQQEAVALARLLDRDLADHPAEIIIFPASVLIPPVIEALGAQTHLSARRIAITKPLVRIQAYVSPDAG